MIQSLPRPKITLRDVAKKAAVSHMTVSRVIRGFQNVSPAVQKRVAAAITSLGYQPDPTLSALSSYRRPKAVRPVTSCIAYIDRNLTPESREILQGAMDEAATLGYAIDHLPFNEDPKTHAHLERMLYHRGIHGLLFGPQCQPLQLKKWQWEKYAAVCVGVTLPEAEMNTVAIDYFQSAFTACQRLQARGCRRVAFIVDPTAEQKTDHRWLGGYCAAVNLENQKLLCSGPVQDVRRLHLWIEQKKVDGILTITPRINPESSAAWQVGRKMNIPCVLLADHGLPATEAMSFDHHGIGAEGVRMLHRSLIKLDYGLPREPSLTFLPSRLIARDEEGREI